MALFMSDEELLDGLRKLADRGQLIDSGWIGFQAIVEGSTGRQWTAAEAIAMRWTFWAGARCIFDALHRLDLVTLDEPRINKLYQELGSDPFCRPPEPSGPPVH